MNGVQRVMYERWDAPSSLPPPIAKADVPQLNVHDHVYVRTRFRYEILGLTDSRLETKNKESEDEFGK